MKRKVDGFDVLVIGAALLLAWLLLSSAAYKRPAILRNTPGPPGVHNNQSMEETFKVLYNENVKRR